jgi:hypothetical protein
MGSEDTVSFLASLQAENATLLARCEQAEATVAACKACMNDLLASPKGVVPQSCERFYRNGAFDAAAEAARGGEQNA